MSFKKNGYCLYKNIISKELTNFLYSYLNTKKEVYFTFQKLKRISPYNLDWGAIGDQAVPGTYNAYGDIAMDNLLQILQPVIEEKTKLKLYPSYTYARMYRKGDESKFHTDRNSRKVSVTLNLGGDLWPFYLIKNKIKIKAMLKSGDGLLYKGCELIHGREKFKGTECLQVFLHYVTNKKYKYRTYVS